MYDIAVSNHDQSQFFAAHERTEARPTRADLEDFYSKDELDELFPES